jgi:hypothetical protein
MTIRPEEPIHIDSRDSCTKDEAVAKLLGWMRSPIRRLIIQINEYGSVSADQLETMHSLDGPLLEFLDGQRESARMEFLDTVEGDATLAEIEEKEAAILIWTRRIEDALKYLRDIESELANGNSLVIDQTATDQTGTRHLTLESLNRWAANTYGISTLAEGSCPPSSIQPEQSPSDTQALDDLPKLRAQEQSIFNVIVDLGHNPKCLPKNKAGKRGVKFAVRTALKGSALFPSARIFDKAWERILEFGDIAYTEEVSSP